MHDISLDETTSASGNTTVDIKLDSRRADASKSQALYKSVLNDVIRRVRAGEIDVTYLHVVYEDAEKVAGRPEPDLFSEQNVRVIEHER
jgi:hypothetical protein